MLKISVLYPNGPNAKFDMTYYCGRHMALCQEVLGAALKRVEVDEGVGGGGPGVPAPYVAIGHLYFDSVESYEKAWAPRGVEIVADVPNYTNVAPVLQVSFTKL